ncbi:MAG TPA: amino acid--tRNA ligase-related protein [Parachlamydiaceae bacterium]|nr:amino acid--tRNA ligase-related protein [Parachlamydiaceae bacterium]
MKNKNNIHLHQQRLKLRHKILSSLRNYFNAQDFLEVETPILVKKTTPDTYIDSIKADEGYLITSTEYQIKRLMADGLQKVFTLTKNFRANDRGRYHSPEFTMLEWGRANESLEDIEEDAVCFIRKAFRELYPDKDTIVFNDNEINFMIGTWERLTVREAFETHLGIKNLDDFSLENLCHASKEAGIQLPIDFQSDKSLAISFLLDQLQSCLGKKTPTFLHEWPSYLTSSAPISSNDPHIAERSELYIGGIEIANGFPFLTDPLKQRILFEEQNLKRKELGKSLIEVDEKYVEALRHLPQGAGMALGVDRLVMILAQATQLSDVQAFDWDEL